MSSDEDYEVDQWLDEDNYPESVCSIDSDVSWIPTDVPEYDPFGDDLFCKVCDDHVFEATLALHNNRYHR